MTDTSRSILITGSSRGIGKACALACAKAGYSVVLHGRTPSEALTQTQSEVQALGVPVRTLTFDVSDEASARTAIEADIEAHGAYWGVIVNAGLTKDNAFPAIDSEGWHRVIDVDLNGFYHVLHPLIMPMVRAKKGGRIIVMSSVSGMMGNRGQVNYSAAKAGLIGATKALAVELAKRRITVNAIAPGMIETEMTELPKDVMDHALSMIPMQRMGRADEVADLALFLLSDKSSYITRQVISVNGGML